MHVRGVRDTHQVVLLRSVSGEANNGGPRRFTPRTSAVWKPHHDQVAVGVSADREQRCAMKTQLARIDPVCVVVSSWVVSWTRFGFDVSVGCVLVVQAHQQKVATVQHDEPPTNPTTLRCQLFPQRHPAGDTGTKMNFPVIN